MVGVPFVPVDGKIRLYEVLAAARVPNRPTFYELSSARWLSAGPDMHKLVVEGDMCENIVMRGGDKVLIAAPSDCSIYVMGEVIHPRWSRSPMDTCPCARHWLARGIPFTGDRNRIQVIRGNLACPNVYVLSWEHSSTCLTIACF